MQSQTLIFKTLLTAENQQRLIGFAAKHCPAADFAQLERSFDPGPQYNCLIIDNVIFMQGGSRLDFDSGLDELLLDLRTELHATDLAAAAYPLLETGPPLTSDGWVEYHTDRYRQRDPCENETVHQYAVRCLEALSVVQRLALFYSDTELLECAVSADEHSPYAPRTPYVMFEGALLEQLIFSCKPDAQR